MASEHNGDREPQSDLAVMEANEYKQKRRLERLLDAVDQVQDTADDAWNAYVAGEISREARNITIQRCVQNAIRESYKLLLDHSQAVEAEDGTRDRYWKGDAHEPLGAVTLLGEDVAVMVGLSDFLEAPTFFETTETVSEERRNMPDETVTRTVETTMPEEISYRAYLRLKEFLDDVHDLEIAFEELEDKLSDKKPTTIDLPDDMDLSKTDAQGFGGPIDDRAVGDDD